jgi:hypothetical protein
VYSPCFSPDISIRAKSPPAEIKAETLTTFIVEPEALMQPIISPIAKTAIPYLTKFKLHYYAVSRQI